MSITPKNTKSNNNNKRNGAHPIDCWSVICNGKRTYSRREGERGESDFSTSSKERTVFSVFSLMSETHGGFKETNWALESSSSSPLPAMLSP